MLEPPEDGALQDERDLPEMAAGAQGQRHQGADPRGVGQVDPRLGATGLQERLEAGRGRASFEPRVGRFTQLEGGSDGEDRADARETRGAVAVAAEEEDGAAPRRSGAAR